MPKGLILFNCASAAVRSTSATRVVARLNLGLGLGKGAHGLQQLQVVVVLRVGGIALNKLGKLLVNAKALQVLLDGLVESL